MPATAGATATSRSACTIPSGTTTCRTCRSRPLAGLLAQGQARRLAGNVRQGDGAELLDIVGMQERPIRRGPQRSGWLSSTALVRRVTLRPKHLVLATGMSTLPEIPKFPGAERFPAASMPLEQILVGRSLCGQALVVIGSNNSAHDIAADLWEHGADVTMVQRSPTVVARSESLMELAQGPLYSEDALASGVTTDIADLTVASLPPPRLPPRRAAKVYEEILHRDRDLMSASTRWAFLLFLRRGRAPASTRNTFAAARATTSTSAPASWWPTAASS